MTSDHDRDRTAVAAEDPGRRQIYAAAFAGAGVWLGMLASARAQQAPPANINDGDLLNFALNLEYLEAEYYSRGVTGRGLPVGSPGAVRGGRKVAFRSAAHLRFFEDVSNNEIAHVNFLNRTLAGDAIPRPAIDFEAGFSDAARAAGLPATFDPFSDEVSFMLGALLFEDVGANAYKGAAPLIRHPAILQGAAGILAIEAYHAGMIRSVLYRMGEQAQAAGNAICVGRDRLAGQETDRGIAVGGRAHFVPADGNGQIYSRTPGQVLSILYGSGPGAEQGGFFPNGVNGRIRAS